MPNARARLLRAALGFLLLEPHAPELVLLHHWLDSWRGVGDVVTGMKWQGYEVSIGDHGGQWSAVFYGGTVEHLDAAGTAQTATPWEAVQRAACAALTKQDVK